MDMVFSLFGCAYSGFVVFVFLFTFFCVGEMDDRYVDHSVVSHFSCIHKGPYVFGSLCLFLCSLFLYHSGWRSIAYRAKKGGNMDDNVRILLVVDKPPGTTGEKGGKEIGE